MYEGDNNAKGLFRQRQVGIEELLIILEESSIWKTCNIKEGDTFYLLEEHFVIS